MDANHKTVLAVIPAREGATIYRRIGTAFPSRDSSTLKVSLDALPTNGRLLICDPKPKKDEAPCEFGEAA